MGKSSTNGGYLWLSHETHLFQQTSTQVASHIPIPNHIKLRTVIIYSSPKKTH